MLRARTLLAELGVVCSVWSVTSYTELTRQALAAERATLLGIDGADGLCPVTELLQDEQGIFVAATDYMKALPMSISRWVPGPYTVLGTDGFGLSEARPDLRNYFEVSAEWIAFAALSTLSQNDQWDREAAVVFARDAGLDLTKMDPASL